TNGAGVLLCTDELSDLEICDRVVVLVRGEVFTEFSNPPFDRDALIHATEGMTDSTWAGGPPYPPTTSSSGDDPKEPRATEDRDPIGQEDE
ncbi:MAG: hypothetical protein ACRDL8_10960, partial [Solirubrobacteraceae bacterium]